MRHPWELTQQRLAAQGNSGTHTLGDFRCGGMGCKIKGLRTQGLNLTAGGWPVLPEAVFVGFLGFPISFRIFRIDSVNLGISILGRKIRMLRAGGWDLTHWGLVSVVGSGFLWFSNPFLASSKHVKSMLPLYFPDFPLSLPAFCTLLHNAWFFNPSHHKVFR